MTAVPLLLALALLAAPHTAARHRLRQLNRPAGPASGAVTGRLGWLGPAAGLGIGLATAAAVGGVAGLGLGCVLGALAAVGVRRALRRQPELPGRLQLGGAWDLLAACLRAGLPTAVGVRAVADHLPGSAAARLTRVADLLVLGASPAAAWAAADGLPGAAALARAARRSATSGAGLARVAAAAASEVRAEAADAAEAGAQRAAVAVAGPLGLCFLPAFLALGVVPVVIGLAEGLIARW